MKRSPFPLIIVSFVGIALAAATLVQLSSAARSSSDIDYLPVVMAPGDPNVTIGNLQDGGVVIGPDGFLVGTVTGTLTSTIQITIARIGPPSTALDPNDTPMGDFYEIRADRDQYTPADHPILLGLPVPTGVVTTHLATAVLIPPDRILYNQGTDSDWFLFRGHYDPAEKLFLTAITGFASGGYQVVLVDSPSLTPLTATVAGASSLHPQSATFEVLCNSNYTPASQCGPAQTNKVAAELVNAYDDFQGLLSFNNPHLMDRYYGLNPMRLFGHHSYYNILLVAPASSSCILEGQYVADSNVEICIPPGSSISAHEIEVIRHEYFHATQYGYDTILNQPAIRWVTDGTATAAQRSVQTMTRTLDYDLHPVDIPITRSTITETYHYAAQDFWVFAGLKNGNGIDYLKPLFEKGAQTQHVVQELGNGTHLPLYWDWVKNQVMEKEHDFDGALTNKCSLQADVVLDRQYFSFHYQTARGYDAGIVEPLNSTVVQVLWDGSYDIADGWVVPTGGSGNTAAMDALRFKLYRDGEMGCETIDDGRRIFDKKDGEISPNRDYYVVISNIDPTQSFPYTVVFEVAPIPPN